jgi:hypothetical protein
LNWEFVAFFAMVSDCPAIFMWEDFQSLASKITMAALRQGVRNPMVPAVLDFMADTENLSSELTQVLHPVVAKAKLQASEWTSVADSYMWLRFVCTEVVVASKDM